MADIGLEIDDCNAELEATEYRLKQLVEEMRKLLARKQPRAAKAVTKAKTKKQAKRKSKPETIPESKIEAGILKYIKKRPYGFTELVHGLHADPRRVKTVLAKMEEDKAVIRVKAMTKGSDGRKLWFPKFALPNAKNGHVKNGVIHAEA
jgi:hypothetical protein